MVLPLQKGRAALTATAAPCGAWNAWPGGSPPAKPTWIARCGWSRSAPAPCAEPSFVYWMSALSDPQPTREPLSITDPKMWLITLRDFRLLNLQLNDSLIEPGSLLV